jgi:hypothetical protein
MGIAREDKAGRAVAVMRNFEFFRAPLVGIVCMHRDLGPVDALSVGMFLQTLLVEVSVAGYSEVVRSQLAIPLHEYLNPRLLSFSTLPQCFNFLYRCVDHAIAKELGLSALALKDAGFMIIQNRVL